MRQVQVTIDFKSFLYAFAAILVLLLAWEIRGVIVMLFIAFILNAGLRPLVDALERRKVPRILSIVIIYLGFLFVFSFIGLILATEFVNQLLSLVSALPSIFSRIVDFLQVNFPAAAELLPLSALQQELGDFVNTVVNSDFVRELLTGQNVLEVLTQTLDAFGSVAGILVGFVTVLMVSAYMLQDKQKFYEGTLKMLPKDQSKSIRNILTKVEKSLGSWLVGQISLMFIIGFITYLLIWLPGLFDPNYILDDFALPIALMAGILEALPNVGPTITLVVSALLAIGTSGLVSVIYIIVSFILLQNLEGMFLVPIVMKKAVGISPILSVLGIIAAFQIADVIGAILVIPLLGIIQIIVVELSNEYKRLEKQRLKLIED